MASKPGNGVAACVLVGLALAVMHGKGGKPAEATAATSAARMSNAAGQAITYAQAQLRKPYVYGATGPGAWDCSGLTQAAYAAARLPIPRTSEAQWAAMRHVSSPQPGDLVFFAGSPIDPPPGHVGIVVSPARHLMIDAYGAGTVVRYDGYGPRATAPGLQNVVGFAEAGAG